MIKPVISRRRRSNSVSSNAGRRRVTFIDNLTHNQLNTQDPLLHHSSAPASTYKSGGGGKAASFDYDSYDEVNIRKANNRRSRHRSSGRYSEDNYDYTGGGEEDESSDVVVPRRAASSFGDHRGGGSRHRGYSEDEGNYSR